MKSPSEIIVLAETKVRAAECLLSNGMYDEAFYIGGYSIELLLKAKVCKTLNLQDFFLFDTSKARPELYKPFKSHDYNQLLLLSGLYNDLQKELSDPELRSSWSEVCNWEEGSRYILGLNKEDAVFFITSLKEICKWIKKYL